MDSTGAQETSTDTLRSVPKLPPFNQYTARKHVLKLASDVVKNEVIQLAAPNSSEAPLLEVLNRSAKTLGWSRKQTRVALAYGADQSKFKLNYLNMTASIHS